MKFEINPTRFITVLIIIIIIVCVVIYSNDVRENYYNMFGDYIDGPFLEKDDRQCRNICNGTDDCVSYNYDPLTEKCYLHSSNGGYLKPHYNHPLYPIYDAELYRRWWFFGPEDQHLVPKKNYYKLNNYAE